MLTFLKINTPSFISTYVAINEYDFYIDYYILAKQHYRFINTFSTALLIIVFLPIIILEIAYFIASGMYIHENIINKYYLVLSILYYYIFLWIFFYTFIQSMYIIDTTFNYYYYENINAEAKNYFLFLSISTFLHSFTVVLIVVDKFKVAYLKNLFICTLLFNTTLIVHSFYSITIILIVVYIFFLEVCLVVNLLKKTVSSLLKE